MTDRSAGLTADYIAFGPFRLSAERKLLLREGEAVAIGHRALDLLVALVRRAGEVVPTAELIAEVWPDRHVSDASIRTQVSLLRKTLGEAASDQRYVVNVAGRGYCFVAPLEAPATAPAPPGPATEWPGALPRRITSLVGRRSGIEGIAAQVRARRFVTIIGAGGIGKTTVAVAVADLLRAEFTSPPCFVDLGALVDPTLTPSTVARALGTSANLHTSGAEIGSFLGDRHMLLILDSCETAIGQAAHIAEAILKATPRVHILATSREPLDAEGEWAHRLPPMATPPSRTAIKAQEALAFPAVELLVDRASARAEGFVLTDANAALAADICRRLDGIPLAIELAAGRVAHLGLQDLASRLDDRFALLMRGRRTALPRHRTLQATIDWSYQLLSPLQQAVLRCLSSFRGAFTREAALAVCTRDGHDAGAILDVMTELVDKSLLNPHQHGEAATYRLLDTTRAYLLDRQAEQPDAGAGATQAHARYFRDMAERHQAAWERLDVTQALQVARRDLDNIRAALDWSLGTGAEPATGIALTIAATPVWLHLSLFEEGRDRLRHALEALDAMHGADPQQAMALLAGLGDAMLQLADPALDEVWARLLALAEAQADVPRQLRALTGLMSRAMTRDLCLALSLAHRVRAVGEGAGAAAVAKGERQIGFLLHLTGDQPAARRVLEAMLDTQVRPPDRRHLLRFNFDDAVGAKATLGQVLWLQGEPDRAMRVANEAVAEALALQHDHTLHIAVGGAACPVAVLRGDIRDAALAFDQLRGTLSASPQKALWGVAFGGIALMQQGQLERGLAQLQEGLGAMRPGSYGRDMPLLHAQVVEGLLRLGRGAEALATAEATLLAFRATGQGWFEPEFLRLQAEALLAVGGKAAEAEALLQAARDLATRQGALAWQLRATTSLAALWRAQGRGRDAAAILAPVLARFAEGFGTADLRAATQLLRALEEAPQAL
ncbi:ATP-binding protein [Falsiroseomonas ponticola]|uniref:ATP-binding protein n=1 Tax=Falsiroseomonas ponticola TaxID=2786951 RepID=UPI0019316924|nr:winged helix-turn-helix domain-containing protein [Roseomonas ponticola]